MRAALALACLLLAGCLDASPAPPHGTTPPTDVAPRECPEVTLLNDSPRIITAARQVFLEVRITNCLETPFEFHEMSCRGSSLDVAIVGHGLALHIPGDGPTFDAPWPVVPCEDPVTYGNFSPDESRVKQLWFNGGYSHCEGEVCPFQQSWAPAGDYRVVATLRHPNGSVSRDEGSLTLLAPVIPEPDPASDLEFVVNDTYRVGDTVAVLVRNRGNVTYGYSTYYAACATEFYNQTGYPFRIPPGTHCDIANVSPLRRGETAKLFTWGLDECTKDMWGCAESRRLPPGEYHVRLALGTYRDVGTTSEPTTTIGWDFRLVP